MCIVPSRHCIKTQKTKYNKSHILAFGKFRFRSPWDIPCYRCESMQAAAVNSLRRARAEPDGTRAETTSCLPPKRTSPFKSAGESVQSTAGSRGGRISVSNAGYTTCRGGVRLLVTPSIRQFPLHFPSRASPCASTFRTQYTQINILSGHPSHRTSFLNT